MPYVDNGQRTNDIGHCRRCKGQWVVADGTKGIKRPHITGQMCPFCKSANVFYTKESNR